MDIQEKFKEETGINAYNSDARKYNLDYILWLESKVEQLELDKHLLKTVRERNAFNDGYSLGCSTSKKIYGKS